MVLDEQLTIASANRYFLDTFRLRTKEALGKPLAELAGEAWKWLTLRVALEEILSDRETLEDYVIVHEFAGVGAKTFLLNARRLGDSGASPGQN